MTDKTLSAACQRITTAMLTPKVQSSGVVDQDLAADRSVRRPYVEQIEQVPVIGTLLRLHLRVGPVGSPDEPLGIGAQQSRVERLRVRIVRIGRGQARGAG